MLLGEGGPCQHLEHWTLSRGLQDAGICLRHPQLHPRLSPCFDGQSFFWRPSHLRHRTQTAQECTRFHFWRSRALQAADDTVACASPLTSRALHEMS